MSVPLFLCTAPEGDDGVIVDIGQGGGVAPGAFGAIEVLVGDTEELGKGGGP